MRGIEDELLPALDHFGLGLLPYFPLAGGLLTGKYQPDAPPPEGSRMAKNPSFGERYRTPANNAKVEKLRAFCAARGRTLLEPVSALATWAERHRPTSQAARDRFDRAAATANRNPRGDTRERAQAVG